MRTDEQIWIAPAKPRLGRHELRRLALALALSALLCALIAWVVPP